MYFDTLINISIYDSDDTTLIDDCFSICKEYETLLSATIPESDISKLNTSKGKTVNLSNETIKLIDDSLYYSNITDGMFDISIYPAFELWDFSHNKTAIPDEKDIRDTLAKINYKNIIIDTSNNTASVKNDAQIELGSIAKGYIADKICEYLENKDVHSAIINLGGDIRVLGQKHDNTPFSIGIADPSNPQKAIIGVKASNISIATSGTYERFVEFNNHKYHHILNPKTGYPADTDLSSVTIITPSSENADALCTCAILLGSDKAMNLIESLPDTEAIMIDFNNNLIKSSGADAYIIN